MLNAFKEEEEEENAENDLKQNLICKTSEKIQELELIRNWTKIRRRGKRRRV